MKFRRENFTSFMRVIRTIRIAVATFTAAATLAVGSSGCITAFADGTDENFYVEVNDPPKITFLGDSIAAGYGLDGYSSTDNTQCASYANILSADFESKLPKEASFESNNLAKNGLTSSDLLENLKDGLYDSALAKSDAVVVSIGGNDMLGVLRNLIDSENSIADLVKQSITLGYDLDKSLESFPDNLEQIVDEIHTRTQKDDCRLFVQTLYNPFEDYMISVLDDLGTEKIAMLNETIFSQSDNGKNYLVADIAAAFEGQNAKLTNISSLDIHPNADGHALIAETLEPLIEEQTYTYYDKNAAKKYKSEHGDESDEEDDDEESEEGNMKVVYLALGAAVVITAASAITVITVIRKNKKTKPAK